MAESLRFFVEVSADQATQALKAITTSLNQADVAFKTKMQSIGAASRAAGAEVISLSDRMKRFAREQRAEARTASFFVQEVAQIVPIGGAARSALTQLGGALMGGGPLMIGLGAAAAAVGFLVHHLREKAAAAEEARQKAVALADAERRAAEEERKREQERRAARGMKAASRASDLSDQIEIEERGGNDEARRKQIEHEQRISALRRDAEREMRAGHLENMAAIEVQIELENRLYEAIRRNANARAEIDATTAGTGGYYGARPVSQVMNVQPLLLPEDQTRLVRNATKDQAAYNKELGRSASAAQQWGAQIGDVLGAVATGQATVGQAMAQVGQMVIRSVVQSAIASVQADAARAAAGAAASQAGVPVVGPVLAISAMGAMMSAVLGLLGSMPSARGGWRVPGDVNPITQLHAGEHVIPRDIARRYEEGAPGGGGLHFHGTLVDRDSIYRMYRDTSSPLRRELRKAERRRIG